jgi:hypothetical protein
VADLKGGQQTSQIRAKVAVVPAQAELL